jgi:uncharacterized membrane protein HdeD (DUF308 family)
MILASGPQSSLWVLGMFVAIAMIFQGWNYIGLASAARRLSSPAAV